MASSPETEVEWPGPFTETVSLGTHFGSYYRQDLQDVLRNQFAISNHRLRTMKDIYEHILASPPDTQFAIWEACQDLRRSKRRKPEGANESRTQLSDIVFHNNVNAEDLFRGFDKKALVEVVHRVIRLSSKARTSRVQLAIAVSRSPVDLQNLVMEAIEMIRAHRTEETVVDQSGVRGGQDQRLPTPLNDSNYDWRNTSFLKAVDPAIIRERMTEFINRTNNASLALAACSICAREVYAYECQEMSLDDIPHPQLLYPTLPHPAQQLTRGMLLFPGTYRDNDLLRVCRPCLNQLNHNKKPPLSLANDLWLGDVPRQLQDLSLPERLLIARYIPAAHVVKLYPKKVGSRHIEPDSLHSGLRGNVSSYPLDQRQIADMVTSVKPAPLSLLSSTIAITFVGPKHVPLRWLYGRLPRNFTVRRRKVREALLWLKQNNPIYSCIEISQERLQALPENGVPTELYQVTRISDDLNGLTEEHRNYVPTAHDTEDAMQGEPLGWEDVGLVEPGIEPPSAEFDSQADEPPEVDSIELDWTSVPIFPGHLPLAEEESPDWFSEAYTDEEESDWDDDDDFYHGPDVPPAVIPIQPLGVIDINGENIPQRELMAHALANAATERAPKGDYLIRHGSAFVNEYARKDPVTGQRYDGGPDNPNHLVGCFPWLFPYGRGGFELKKDREVCYEAHARWALQYADKRFRRDPYFMFQVFGVLQKRQVCRSATLHISRGGLQRHGDLLSNLRPEDLLQASREESANRPHQNPVFDILFYHLKAIRRRVEGTDEHRFVVRSMIWGNTLLLNLPIIWMTINPADTQCPIAQVLIGEDIDLDAFSRTAGPDSLKRARNIAGDPYAAAKYFNFIVLAVLEILLGIKPSQGGRPPERREGIFGVVESYIGTVEAQGRGTLHLHMLLWLRDAPPPSVLKEIIKSEEFRERVKEFISTTIHADIDGKNNRQVKALPRDGECSYARPTHPDDPEYDTKFQQRQRILARTLQYHDCDPARCIKKIRGVWRCKARAPWKTAQEAWVNDQGEYGPRRVAEFLNAWCPFILDALRCNHDLQLLLAAVIVAKIVWYITNYATKKQQRSSNVTALLAKRVAFHVGEERQRADVESRNKRLLERCANTLTREREFSGPEVATYLMGWGDRYMSHNYVPIFWDAAERALKRKFPALRNEVREGEESEEQLSSLSLASGVVELQDQLRDYQYRGDELEEYSLFDFILNTYEQSIRETATTTTVEDDDNGAPSDALDGHDIQSEPVRRGVGRPRHHRIPYKVEANKPRKCRIIRSSNHETMPRLVGRWLPPNDEPRLYPLYCASILMLLKPWRQLEDLHGQHPSFSDSLQEYLSTCPRRDRQIVENLQFYHQCARDAKADALDAMGPQSDSTDRSGFTDAEVPDEDDVDTATETIDTALEQILDRLSESQLREAETTQMSDRERLFAEVAIMKAKNAHFFDDSDANGPTDVLHSEQVRRATEEEVSNIGRWQSILESATRAVDTEDSRDVDEADDDGEAFVRAEEAAAFAPLIQPGVNGNISDGPGEDSLVDMLNEEQRRAHDIIVNHLVNHLDDVPQEQLLMQVQGEGGTGKSLLIAAITRSFDRLSSLHLLAKTATTGVAAIPIGGTTVHSWAHIPINVPNIGDDWVSQGGPKRKEARIRKISGKAYLIIDEVSMMTKKMLWNLNQVVRSTQLAAEVGDPSKPFGGMNVILFGDFHQFPPVGNPTGALYCERPDEDVNSALLGRELFKQFHRVVILRRQNRSQDVRWNQLLGRLREGLCTDEDVDILRGLVLDQGPSDALNFYDAPWNSAVLVTPRHSVRHKWNHHAMEKLATTTGQVRFIVTAQDEDCRTGLKPSNAVRLAMAQKTEKDMDRGKLDRELEVVEGMMLMVLLNVATEAEVANGTRGVLERILLDPREPPLTVEEGGVCRLKYLPVSLWIRPLTPTALTFPGVPSGLVPLAPRTARYQGITASKRPYRVVRKQYPITPAYAFTDYKSQAQTIEKVIVDIGKPPTGNISPFNVYVALSRSRGREHIRLLRDFDEGLLTRHPSEDLRREMMRIRALDAETTEWWRPRAGLVGRGAKSASLAVSVPDCFRLSGHIDD
ncbi:hypothetical protein CC1G_04942 [Coprinopsis cinerea okayama7|uniref:ATP-dependent DNA helicase n=1 Tax=Coprinopsis cinerea (strain Okayama-7 / 130 / ATCC MYA-4618 / FGSC 9003) TaxID=240176 RepID=A8PFM6_COPC7|nr:hypothetical protein CC1G_04942 [Coprinopsis cinerea okayama7\|eukprot:XP_001841098.2 hypothetical protein CC1G_04942 [Coprinopsis cinerea okayama7\